VAKSTICLWFGSIDLRGGPVPSLLSMVLGSSLCRSPRVHAPGNICSQIALCGYPLEDEGRVSACESS
jgi:hypothetical protein